MTKGFSLKGLKGEETLTLLLFTKCMSSLFLKTNNDKNVSESKDTLYSVDYFFISCKYIRPLLLYEKTRIS